MLVYFNRKKMEYGGKAKSRKYQGVLIRGEKSSKDMASSKNLVSTIGAQASPTMGDGTRCPEG